MMTTDQLFILSLLRKSLRLQESANDGISQCTDKQSVIKTVLQNGILLTVYQQLPDDIKAQATVLYFAALKQSVLQEHEGEQVLKALSNAGLDCIALKGWELRKLYPKPDMRQMADMDILISPYDYGIIKSLMEGLGFTSESESSWKHDSFRKNEVHLEMHKRLTDDSNAVQAWEKGLWSRAIPVEGHIWRMSAEDFYIFHFVHLHKDFLNGKLGLRRIADTWLLQKQQVDTEFVKTKLEAFGMWTFHERMVRLSRVAMGEEESDECSDILLTHAFTHGIYGSGKSYKVGRIAAMGSNVKSGMLKSKINAVFLPYKRMKAQFPILERWPILLPYCWVKRILNFLKGDMKRSRRMLDYSKVKDEDYQEMKRFFEAGGV